MSRTKGSVLRDTDGFVFLRASLPDGKRKSWKLVVECSHEEQMHRARLLAVFVEKLSPRHADRIDAVARKLCALDVAHLEDLRAAVDEICAETSAKPLTVKDVADMWTSGELTRKYGKKYVQAKRSVADDINRFNKHIFPAIGHVPIKNVTRDLAMQMIYDLPKTLSTQTVLNIGNLLSRIMHISVNQLKIIGVSPLSKGWLPSEREEKRKLFLYPNEARALLSCQKISRTFRFLCGLQLHEGLRVGEAMSLKWSQIDLEAKIIRLHADKVKTKEHRSWKLGDDTVRAFQAWKNLHPHTVFVFEAPRKSDTEPRSALSYDKTKMARKLRNALRIAGVMREELFEKGESLIPIRMHDLRATFVTIASASGKSERWIRNRTGHKSVAILDTYQREIDLAIEAEFGWFDPLDATLTIGSKLEGGEK